MFHRYKTTFLKVDMFVSKPSLKPSEPNWSLPSGNAVLTKLLHASSPARVRICASGQRTPRRAGAAASPRSRHQHPARCRGSPRSATQGPSGSCALATDWVVLGDPGAGVSSSATPRAPSFREGEVGAAGG